MYTQHRLFTVIKILLYTYLGGGSACTSQYMLRFSPLNAPTMTTLSVAQSGASEMNFILKYTS